MKWKYRFGAVAGNTLEYYDIAVFAAISSYLSAELERLGYNQATEMVWGIFALRFIIRPVGGYIIGRYAEEAGKKPALVLTSLITGINTLYGNAPHPAFRFIYTDNHFNFANGSIV